MVFFRKRPDFLFETATASKLAQGSLSNDAISFIFFGTRNVRFFATKFKKVLNLEKLQILTEKRDFPLVGCQILGRGL